MSPDARKEIEKSLPHLHRLTEVVADQKSFDDRLLEYAKRTETSVVRDARAAMRGTLEKHGAGLSDAQRMDLISAALEVIRLNNADASSTSRSLLRYDNLFRPGKRNCRSTGSASRSPSS